VTFAINLDDARAEPSCFNINLENNYENNYHVHLTNFTHESVDTEVCFFEGSDTFTLRIASEKKHF